MIRNAIKFSLNFTYGRVMHGPIWNSRVTLRFIPSIQMSVYTLGTKWRCLGDESWEMAVMTSLLCAHFTYLAQTMHRKCNVTELSMTWDNPALELFVVKNERRAQCGPLNHIGPRLHYLSLGLSMAPISGSFVHIWFREKKVSFEDGKRLDLEAEPCWPKQHIGRLPCAQAR
jgi:hypothetical protein